MTNITLINFLIGVNIILIIFLLLNFINLHYFRKIILNSSIIDGDLISVLIPARNEEENIRACVTSVLNQTYKNIEIIILDDNSEDKTSEIVQSFTDNNLILLKGKPLPEGWVGKNFSCDQLYEASKGNYILFIDADTVLNPECISSALRFAKENNTGLLSVMPYEISKSFWEKTVIPMLYFAVLVFLPIPFIERSTRKQFAMGNGQFMLFSRKCYKITGGHKSLKNKIVEDVWMARRVKELRQKLIFADGTDIIKCRMYKNFDEVWNGFSKNFFAGLSFSVTGLFILIFSYFILFIIPLIILIYALFMSNHNLTVYSFTALLIPVVIRLTHSFRFRQPVMFSFIFVMSILFLIAVSINSFIIIKFGKGAKWKGRDYKESIIK